MTLSPVRRNIVIGISTLLCVVLIGIAGGAYYVWEKKSVSPAHFLPKEETVLYMINDDDAVGALAKKFVPLWSIDGSLAAAFVESPTASGNIIFFENPPEVVPGMEVEPLGPYLAHFSTPALRHMISENNALATDASFKDMQKLYDDAPWLYVKKSWAPPMTQPLEQFFLSFVQPETTAYGVSFQSDSIVLSFAHEADAKLETFKATHDFPALESAAVMFETALLPDIFANIQENQDVSGLALQGLLEFGAKNRWGTDFSLQYDMGPLLLKPTLVAITPNREVLLQGSAPSSLLEDTLNKIHASAQKKIAAGQVEHHVFEDDFETVTIRGFDSEIAPTALGSYTVLQTMGGDGKGIISAQDDSRFIISTSKQLFDEFVTGMQMSPAPSISPQNVAAHGRSLEEGMWYVLRPWAEDLLFGQEYLTSMLNGKGLKWTFSSQKNIDTLVLQ